MTSYCDHWVANQLDMRTPHYDSDESGSELSGSWLDISKDERFEDDEHLSSTASAMGSSTISNISTSEVSTDTEGFSLSSDESQPDLDDNDDEDEDDDVDSDKEDDKTPAASFNKFTSSFIFPDPTSSFSTIEETPVPSIYNVPSEPMWEGIKDPVPSRHASSDTATIKSTSAAVNDKTPATGHPFQASAPATPSSKRRYLTAIASAVVLSLLVKIGPMVLQHNIGALVANTFSAPGPLDAVPTYSPPAAQAPERTSDESVIARALAALSEQPMEPTKPQGRSKTTSHSSEDKPQKKTVSAVQDTSLSVPVKSELSVVPASTSLFIKEVIEEHFTDPVTLLTRNVAYQIGNLSVWSYELLVVLSRVTVDFLAKEIHLAQTEISHELSRIRAAAETLYARRGEFADQVTSAASHSAQQVREAARLSAKQAHDAASYSLQQANHAASYSTRKAREAYGYLFRVASQNNRKAARGARRVVREVSQSSVRKAGSKGAQKARSQLGSSLAAGAQLATSLGQQAVRGALSVKNTGNKCKDKRGCGSNCGWSCSKSKSKKTVGKCGGGGSKKSKSRWRGRKSGKSAKPERECDHERGFWKRVRR